MKTESYISIEGDVTLPTGKSSEGPQTLPLPLPLVLVLSIVCHKVCYKDMSEMKCSLLTLHKGTKHKISHFTFPLKFTINRIIPTCYINTTSLENLIIDLLDFS